MKCKVCGSCTIVETYSDAYDRYIEYRCPMNCRGGNTVVIERLPDPPRNNNKEEKKGVHLRQEEKTGILTLTAQGKKYDEIAETTGYPKPTIWKVRGIFMLAGILASKYFKGGLGCQER